MRRSWFYAALACALLTPLACAEEDPDLPSAPPGNDTGHDPTLGDGDGDGDGDTDAETEGDTDAETDTDTDGDACDPYGDPGAECPNGQACSFVTETCENAVGKGELEEPCEVLDPDLVIDDCEPGLVCVFEQDARCLVPCQPDIDDCDEGYVCGGLANQPPEGVCFETCDLVEQTCSRLGDACYPVSSDDEVVAACLPTINEGFEGTPCETQSDCIQGFTCSDASQHVNGCLDGAAACCTALCDQALSPCFGANTFCDLLDIEGQPDAGYCVAP